MRSFFAACLVQSEFGDFDPDDVDCQTTGYISNLNLIPNPSEDILERIRDLHRQRRGQKPFEADFALLEKIKAIETYGAKPVNCKDSHQVDCRLSPSPKGIWKYSIENHSFFHMKCNPGPKKKPILV